METPFMQDLLIAHIKEVLPPPSIYTPVHAQASSGLTTLPAENLPKKEKKEPAEGQDEKKDKTPSWFGKGMRLRSLINLS